MAKDNFKLIANNKKARHDYFLEETYEAGISLHGTEVKSLRMGKCSIKEAFIHIENGEVIHLRDAYQPLRKGKYLQQRSAAPEKASDAQKGDLTNCRAR